MKEFFGEIEKSSKYARQAIRWEDKGDHYELIFSLINIRWINTKTIIDVYICTD